MEAQVGRHCVGIGLAWPIPGGHRSASGPAKDGREMDYTYLKLSGGAVTVLGLDDDNRRNLRAAVPTPPPGK